MTDNHTRELTILGARTKLPANPDQATIECFPNAYAFRDYTISFDCPEFTSLCPITGQPDFAHLTITYTPDKLCIESKSLKFYLGSFRNTGMFHEEITNRILQDLVTACQPRWMRVVGRMHPRGGIAIEVTAEYHDPSQSGKGTRP